MRARVEFDARVEAESEVQAQELAEHLAAHVRDNFGADWLTFEVAVVVEERPDAVISAAQPVFDLDDNGGDLGAGFVELS